VNLPQVGGMAALKGKLGSQIFDFFPKIGDVSLDGITGGALAISVGAFFAHVGLQWWSSWYPGADPGGGGYIAQRMMSAKDEKHSLFATLWFTIAHYTLRPWPWIIVALSALVLLPRAENVSTIQAENPQMYEIVVQAYNSHDVLKSANPIYQTVEFKQMYEKYENTVDPGVMYPKIMVNYLPGGLLGLLIAVFLAAYMSTLASQLNWGTSYLINDFYRRFVVKEADEKHYVLISRIGIFFMIVFSLFITKYFLTTISGAWEFIINASAGMGAVLILRWYWWRINAWSEISAMVAPLIIYPIAKYYFGMESPITLYPIVLGTSIVWLVVTFITEPVKEEKLIKFYRLTFPGGIGWKKISDKIPDMDIKTNFSNQLVNWLLGIVVVYSFLFGIGQIIFLEYLYGTIILIVGLLSASVIYKNLKKENHA
ncbi:MAG: sodium:proline symporter, partial [Melioribacteraceae bacterium]